MINWTGYPLLALLLSATGLFLSIWIVITAPIRVLFPLSVGAPEVSPWLIGLNTLAILLSLAQIQAGWFWRGLVGCSLVGLLLSSLPLLQLPTTNQQFAANLEHGLGMGYLAKIPAAIRIQMRPRIFVLTEVFTGIAARSWRYTPGIQFAAPDGVPLTMDMYRPPTKGQYPGIVVIYGGAWRSGSPTDNATFNRYMAARGYTVVAISYRLAPHYRFPAQLEDVNAALTFIRQHAAEYEIDINRMAILGRSAGAHLAMLAAYQPNALPLQAVVNYYGPLDLRGGYQDPPSPDPLKVRDILKTFIGGTPDELPTQYQLASPIHFVRSGLPPTLLVYGSRDHVVQAKFGRQLRDRLHASGNTAIMLEIPWAEHAFDAIFSGVSNQLALYYTERFLAWALR
ncbi:MAG: alpha/beta hydrolase [Leptolyngbyaceae cyanobacterium RU_5_1]|nr:alpha/beta hydrolase [Leptolyngbyaceae cyanobacterium RU_5_1]